MWIAALRRTATRLLLLGAAATLVVSCATRPPGRPLLPPPDLRIEADRLFRLRIQPLNDNPQLCRIVLEEAGIRHMILPGREGPGQCGYVAAVRRQAPGPRWQPDAPATSCAVAATLHLWERDVLAPAAQRHFGEPVAVVRHMGAFACRTIAGGGTLSEHGRANAIDIGGFRLASGREISVLRDWSGGTAADRAFLREVRDGACRIFGTVLSPDYNAAHADHFHFDQAARGGFGFCR